MIGGKSNAGTAHCPWDQSRLLSAWSLCLLSADKPKYAVPRAHTTFPAVEDSAEHESMSKKKKNLQWEIPLLQKPVLVSTDQHHQSGLRKISQTRHQWHLWGYLGHQQGESFLL